MAVFDLIKKKYYSFGSGARSEGDIALDWYRGSAALL